MNAPAQIRANSARDNSFSQFDVTPATPVLGAYLSGLNLAEVTEAAAEELRAALWRYGVLFLRDQHLTPEQLTAAGYLFGPQLEEHTFGKTMADEGHPEVLVIEQMQSDRAKTHDGHLAPRCSPRGKTPTWCQCCRHPRCPLAPTPCGPVRQPLLSGCPMH